MQTQDPHERARGDSEGEKAAPERDSASRPTDIDAQIDELGEESFPASDPPQGPARIWSGAGDRASDADR